MENTLVRCAKCGSRVFNSAICLDCEVGGYYEYFNKGIKEAREAPMPVVVEFGKTLASECQNSKATGVNVGVLLLEEVRSIFMARFGESGKEIKNPLFIDEGTYTIAYPDSDETFTFRVRTVKTGKLAGKTVVDYLKGTDPTAVDFEAFAFVNTYTLNVFFKYERLGGSSGVLVNKAREIEELIRTGKEALESAGFAYAQRSNRCRFCNHVLTDDASKAAGCGITCAENHGVPHAGLEEKMVRKTRRVEEVAVL